MKKNFYHHSAMVIFLLAVLWIDNQYLTMLTGIGMWLFMAAIAIGLTIGVVLSVGISLEHPNAPSIEKRVSLAKSLCKEKDVVETLAAIAGIVPSLIVLLLLDMKMQAYTWAGFIMIAAPAARMFMTYNVKKFLSHN